MKFSLRFKQLVITKPFNKVTGMCQPCQSEKYFIMFKPKGVNINSWWGIYQGEAVPGLLVKVDSWQVTHETNTNYSVII